jgi:hypothetical protein
MVQTGTGAARNEWITYMRQCAANYHAAREGATEKHPRVRVKPKARRKAKPETAEPTIANQASLSEVPSELKNTR